MNTGKSTDVVLLVNIIEIVIAKLSKKKNAVLAANFAKYIIRLNLRKNINIISFRSTIKQAVDCTEESKNEPKTNQRNE